MRFTMMAVLLAVMSCGLLGKAVPAAQRTESFTLRKPGDNPNGWWIRVNTKDTKATAIAWQFGTNPKDLTAKDAWKLGGPAETVLPLPLRTRNLIAIQATATPPDATASFCVFLGQKGVALFTFTNSELKELNPNQSEERCDPGVSAGRIFPN
jgi:hypothetical protein